MKRIMFALVTLCLVAGVTPARAQGQPAPVAASPTNAATFLGDWTISATGNYGPQTFAVTLKAAEGKVVGEVSSTTLAKQAVTEISKAGTSLVLRYVFDYQGMPINAVITLTPADNKVDAYLDFADGAAQMSGTATKKTN